MGLPHKSLFDDRDIATIMADDHNSHTYVRVRERRMQRYIVQQLITNFRGVGQILISPLLKVYVAKYWLHVKYFCMIKYTMCIRQ